MYCCSVKTFLTLHDLMVRNMLSSQKLSKFTFIALMTLSNHLILCRPLLFLPSIFPVSGFFLRYPIHPSHEVVKILELQYLSFQLIVRVDFL